MTLTLFSGAELKVKTLLSAPYFLNHKVESLASALSIGIVTKQNSRLSFQKVDFGMLLCSPISPVPADLH